jgi:cell division protein FtsW (lipid II flippase)
MKQNELIQKFKSQLKYIDRVYWLLFAVLIIVAILALFSASSTLAFAENSTLNPIINQMTFIALGVLLAFV